MHRFPDLIDLFKIGIRKILKIEIQKFSQLSIARFIIEVQNKGSRSYVEKWQLISLAKNHHISYQSRFR